MLEINSGDLSFVLWLHPFILSGAISPLFSSSVLGTYWPGEFLFQYPIILPFHPAVDVTGDRSKVRCSKEQYCIGTWNVRSMNQGKLEVTEQEMARVNIDILGIRELKWTGMGEFNSEDHYIYYCGQESLRINEVAIIVKSQKSPKCSTWMPSQKQQNDLCSFPRQIIQYHSNPSLCPDQ